MTRWVIDLQAADAANRELVGGKAAHLHELLTAGLSVPDAFVVTTEAFHSHFPTPDPAQVPEPPELQAPLLHELQRAVEIHFPEADMPLAVRSSAVAEDTAGASFAGQHDTYYYIDRNSVSQAVRQCWLSLWSAHARSYRADRGRASTERFAMAVVVQRMVQADRAGVCFTTDPTGQFDSAVCIEATWGLGAALVDGRVSPDRLFLSRSGTVLRQHIGRKRHKVSASMDNPDGSRLEPVPAQQQGVSVLSDEQAEAVLQQSLAAEALFGGPQDVEWAFAGNSLFILQSRPITTLAASDGSVAARPEIYPSGEWILFKPVAENFLEPLTPMSVDLLGQVLPASLGRFIDGRYYLNFRRMAQLLPFKWSNRQLADAILLRGAAPRLKIDWRKAPFAAVAGVIAYLAVGISWHRTARLSRESLGAFAELCRSVEADESYDSRAALFRLAFGRGPFESMGRQALQANISAGRYFLYIGALRSFLARYAPDFPENHINHLCSGEPDMRSRQMIEGIQQLAKVAAEDPQLAAKLNAQAPGGYSELLASLPIEHPFSRALTDFLSTYGHRCVREIELATPRWREDPATVLQMVRNYLQEDLQIATDRHSLHLLARDALRQALPRRWQQRLALYLVRRVRYYVTLREDTRHYHTMAFATVRGKLMNLGLQLVQDERLRVQEDVFFLSWAEADALSRGELDWMDVAGRVRQRRRLNQSLSRQRPPETIHIADMEATSDGTSDEQTGSQELKGHCASPGTAEGPVRIITDPTTAAHLAPGDILVAPYTDPAWTPLFPIAAAVVVEVGSYLSHAGTIAREYQIPCLVDVGDCTSKLRDGQRVRVLADEGRIEIVTP